MHVSVADQMAMSVSELAWMYDWWTALKNKEEEELKKLRG